MSVAVGPGCDPALMLGGSPLEGSVIDVFRGDAIVLPLTWWQVPPVYASDGKTIVTPGVPVNMTGMVPSAEFLTYGIGAGIILVATAIVPTAGTWTITVPGRGQAGDLTSTLVEGPPKLTGPRIRLRYADAAGNPLTFGTLYLRVK